MPSVPSAEFQDQWMECAKGPSHLQMTLVSRLQETHVPKSSKQRSFAGTESSNMTGRRTLPDSRGPTGIPLALNLCLEPHPEQA